MRPSTANELFIDTSGFYASVMRRDDMNTDAAEILAACARKRQTIVTTNMSFTLAMFGSQSKPHGSSSSRTFDP